jgi:hypothetical protein
MPLDLYYAIITVLFAQATALLFVSCILSNDWWNLFVILPLIFVPIPFVMFGVGSEYSIALDGTNSVWKSIVEFLGGFFISCAFAIVGVTYHWGKVNRFVKEDFLNLFE